MTIKKEITIYDIAREAGVSTATVSRILSNTKGVKQEKRERVQALVDQFNFKPSALARGLSETHSKVIGMLCPDVRNAYYANIFMECEKLAFEKGYTLVLNNTFAQVSLEIAFMEKLSEQRVESLAAVLAAFDWRAYEPAACRAQAECFSAASFRREITAYLARTCAPR